MSEATTKMRNSYSTSTWCRPRGRRGSLALLLHVVVNGVNNIVHVLGAGFGSLQQELAHPLPKRAPAGLIASILEDPEPPHDRTGGSSCTNIVVGRVDEDAQAIKVGDVSEQEPPLKACRLTSSSKDGRTPYGEGSFSACTTPDIDQVLAGLRGASSQAPHTFYHAAQDEARHPLEKHVEGQHPITPGGRSDSRHSLSSWWSSGSLSLPFGLAPGSHAPPDSPSPSPPSYLSEQDDGRHDGMEHHGLKTPQFLLRAGKSSSSYLSPIPSEASGSVYASPAGKPGVRAEDDLRSETPPPATPAATRVVPGGGEGPSGSRPQERLCSSGEQQTDTETTLIHQQQQQGDHYADMGFPSTIVVADGPEVSPPFELPLAGSQAQELAKTFRREAFSTSTGGTATSRGFTTGQGGFASSSSPPPVDVSAVFNLWAQRSPHQPPAAPRLRFAPDPVSDELSGFPDAHASKALPSLRLPPLISVEPGALISQEDVHLGLLSSSHQPPSAPRLRFATAPESDGLYGSPDASASKALPSFRLPPPTSVEPGTLISQEDVLFRLLDGEGEDDDMEPLDLGSGMFRSQQEQTQGRTRSMDMDERREDVGRGNLLTKSKAAPSPVSTILMGPPVPRELQGLRSSGSREGMKSHHSPSISDEDMEANSADTEDNSNTRIGAPRQGGRGRGRSPQARWTLLADSTRQPQVDRRSDSHDEVVRRRFPRGRSAPRLPRFTHSDRPEGPKYSEAALARLPPLDIVDDDEDLLREQHFGGHGHQGQARGAASHLFPPAAVPSSSSPLVESLTSGQEEGGDDDDISSRFSMDDSPRDYCSFSSSSEGGKAFE